MLAGDHIMNNMLQAFTPTLPASSLDSYIHYANKLPMLTLAEEQAYAKQVHENSDLDAAKKLILPHLRYVIKVARGYLGYGLSLGDLVQEGNIGLMKAVKRFNPEVGVRLVSFAVHWIKAEIHEFILKNWRIVKMATTKAQRKLFFNLRKMKKRLGWFSKQEIDDVAKDLGVKPHEVEQMEARLNRTDSAFDGYADQDDSATQVAFAPAQYLEDNSANPETLYEETTTAASEKQSLLQAMQSLDERSKTVVQARWLDDKKQTLHDLAAKLGVSAERIRQIEQAAFKKIKAHIGDESAA
jgi:RNA polymerase sigma-32 factor